MEEKMIPCRYIGTTEVMLAHFGGPYKDAEGKPLADLVLHTSDTLMMRESEVLGMTIKFDPRGVLDPNILGVGRVLRPEDAKKSDDELFLLGYQFHAGREDFEPITTETLEVKAAPTA